MGLESNKIHLDKISPSGIVPADSTVTDGKGNFRFCIALPDSEPVMYNLRVNGETIPLILSPGEKVNITSVYGNPRMYSVEGSEGSALIKDLNDMLYNGASKLDSIASTKSLYESRTSRNNDALREYTREYYNIKREHIKFITTNSGSLAGIYGLYQRLPGDEVLFNGETDIIYYRMVADSVQNYHPKSPYLARLKKDIAATEANQEFMRRVQEQLAHPLPFPDLELPDIYDIRHRLSDNLGKVIVLDFWLASEKQSPVVNAEYRELYDKYPGDGFVIYQINAGTSRPDWVNAVLDQRLPWITVSDLRGIGSPAVMHYNVNTIPSNFLISASGDIVGRNLYGTELQEAVAAQIRKAETPQ